MISFKQYMAEQLKGLSKPIGRFAARPITKVDPETGKKDIVGDYPEWVAPTSGSERKAGKESWALNKLIDKRNEKLAASKKKVAATAFQSRAKISGVDLKPYRRGE